MPIVEDAEWDVLGVEWFGAIQEHLRHQCGSIGTRNFCSSGNLDVFASREARRLPLVGRLDVLDCGTLASFHTR